MYYVLVVRTIYIIFVFSIKSTYLPVYLCRLLFVT